MSSTTVTPNLATRTRAALTPLNLHAIGAFVLLALNVYLAVQLFFAWNQVRQSTGDAITQQQVAVKTADIAALPLRGLDTKLADARAEAAQFTKDRLPYKNSTIYEELGALAKKHNVKLTRGSYVPTAVEDSPDPDITEVRIDATLSGDYRPLVQFVNSLERDKIFFLINAVTFTGQAGGGNNNVSAGSVVNLRLRLTTYIRQPIPEDVKKEAKP